MYHVQQDHIALGLDFLQYLGAALLDITVLLDRTCQLHRLIFVLLAIFVLMDLYCLLFALMARIRMGLDPAHARRVRQDTFVIILFLCPTCQLLFALRVTTVQQEHHWLRRTDAPLEHSAAHLVCPRLIRAFLAQRGTIVEALVSSPHLDYAQLDTIAEEAQVHRLPAQPTTLFVREARFVLLGALHLFLVSLVRLAIRQASVWQRNVLVVLLETIVMHLAPHQFRVFALLGTTAFFQPVLRVPSMV